VLVSVDFAEIEQLQATGAWDKAAAVLARAARQIEAGGADLLVLCTNTVHKVAAQVQGIILGCTEIELLVTQADSPVPVFPTTRLHAQAAVERALAPTRRRLHTSQREECAAASDAEPGGVR
jgi:aspartate/glutamate racemase